MHELGAPFGAGWDPLTHVIMTSPPCAKAAATPRESGATFATRPFAITALSRSWTVPPVPAKSSLRWVVTQGAPDRLSLLESAPCNTELAVLSGVPCCPYHACSNVPCADSLCQNLTLP